MTTQSKKKNGLMRKARVKFKKMFLKALVAGFAFTLAAPLAKGEDGGWLHIGSGSLNYAFGNGGDEVLKVPKRLAFEGSPGQRKICPVASAAITEALTNYVRDCKGISGVLPCRRKGAGIYQKKVYGLPGNPEKVQGMTNSLIGAFGDRRQYYDSGIDYNGQRYYFAVDDNDLNFRTLADGETINFDPFIVVSDQKKSAPITDPRLIQAMEEVQKKIGKGSVGLTRRSDGNIQHPTFIELKTGAQPSRASGAGSDLTKSNSKIEPCSPQKLSRPNGGNPSSGDMRLGPALRGAVGMAALSMVFNYGVRNGYFGESAQEAVLEAERVSADTLDNLECEMRDPETPFFNRVFFSGGIAGEMGLIQ